MPGGAGGRRLPRQQTLAAERPSIPLTPASFHDATCHYFANAVSAAPDDGNDLRVQATKAAPDDATGREHLYLHFNEWSRAQRK
jgi:hypothetical protein